MRPEQIIAILRIVGTANGWRDTTVGTYAVNDGKFLRRLAEGKTCTLSTVNAALQWASDLWPRGQSWPQDIPRPAPRTKEDS